MKFFNKALNLLCLGAMALAFFVACDQDDLINHRPELNKEDELVDNYPPKKGFGQTHKGGDWSVRLSQIMPHWYYSWGASLSDMRPEGIPYVPMQWGKWNTDTNIALMKEWATTNKIKYVLGFNEPDGEEQANMTVDEAIAIWPALEEIGVPLGSPAPAGNGGEWLEDFMQKAEQNNLRVDFICVHRYSDSRDAKKWLEAFQEIYNKYKKPLWITEMALADWNATSPETNKHTAEGTLTFMKELLPLLDKAEFIERYAWFDGGQGKGSGIAALHHSKLFEGSELTPLGRHYADHSPNLDAGLGKEPPVIDYGLVVDGGFENTSVESGTWGGYDNGYPDNAGAKAGSKVGKINRDGDNGDGGSIFQDITVDGNTKYELKYSTKWENTPDGTIKALVHDRTPGDNFKTVLYEAELSTSTDWADVVAEVNTLPTTTEIRILFWKGGSEADMTVGASSALFIDEVYLNRIGDAEVQPNEVPDTGLILDGSFESSQFSDSSLPWYGFDISIIEEVTSAKSGEKYAKLGLDANGDGAFLQQELDVDANGIYELKFSNKWTNASTEGIVRVFDITDGKSTLFEGAVAESTNWTDKTYSFETGASTSRIRIVLIKKASESTNELFIDDVILNKTGVVEAPVAVNLVSEGDFENVDLGALSAASTPWSGYNSGTTDVVGSAITAPYAGDKCVRLKKDEASVAQTITVEAEKTYVFSFYSKWYDGNGTNLKFTIKPSNQGSIKHQETITATTDWTQTTFEYTVPAGHTSLTFNVYKVKNNDAGFFVMDEVSVTEKVVN